MTQHTTRLQNLDTLRGIAILMVIAFHTSIGFALSPSLFATIQMGNQGVQLFFLISAITMCLMWDARKDETHRIEKFYIRRFMRIAPLYWFALIFYAAWGYIIGDSGHTQWQIVSNLLFIHGFSQEAINSAVPGGWSIAVEMSFYLAFPLLYRHLDENNNASIYSLLIAFGIWIVVSVFLTDYLKEKYALSDIFIYYSQLTQLPIFALGICTYSLCFRKKTNHTYKITSLIVIWLSLAFIGKFVAHLNTRPFFWCQNFIFSSIIYIFIWKNYHINWISNLGKKSYAMYLFHFFVIKVMSLATPGDWHTGILNYAIFFIITVTTSSLIANISAITVEKWSSEICSFWIKKSWRIQS